MNNIITIGLCTWQRPKELKRMLDSLYATWHTSIDLDLVIVFEWTDPYLDEYEQLILSHPLQQYIIPHIKHNTTNSHFPVKGNDALYNGSVGDFLIGVSDNIEFKTMHWNLQVVDKLKVYPDELVVMYFNNGFSREKAEFLGMTRKWMELQGFFVPTQFEHFSCDEYVEWIAHQCGRLVWMKDIVFYHWHPKFGQVPRDDTWASSRELDKNGENMSMRDARLYKTTFNERHEFALKIMRAIEAAKYE